MQDLINNTSIYTFKLKIHYICQPGEAIYISGNSILSG